MCVCVCVCAHLFRAHQCHTPLVFLLVTCTCVCVYVCLCLTVSLQAWLEAAWSAGFDLAGAQSLGGSVQGESKWVGTTEAATLLAHQNVPTRIIDFKSK